MVDVPQVPSMETEGLELFEDHLDRSSVYLEYGCGGSTLMAVRHGMRHIVAVETDWHWMQGVLERLSGSSGSVQILHCDLGPVESWGLPADKNRIHEFHRYAFMPWKAARDANVTPDLVLVDGRFRVASFLVSLAYARIGTVILFDDYVGRSHYHVVERFCPCAETRGRMAKFVVDREVSPIELLEAVAKYSIIRK